MLNDLFPELQRVYCCFNKTLFGNTLPKKLEFLWDSSDKQCLRYLGKQNVLRIGLGINSITAKGFLDELLHQMVHIYNRQCKIRDCNSQCYHNKNFVNKALSLGLYVSKHPSKGFAITTSCLHDKLIEPKYPSKESIVKLSGVYTLLKFDEDLFNEIRNNMLLEDRLSRQGKYLLKYVCKCPSPHNTIRSGRRPYGKSPLNITCNICNSKFICDEGEIHERKK